MRPRLETAPVKSIKLRDYLGEAETTRLVVQLIEEQAEGKDAPDTLSNEENHQ